MKKGITPVITFVLIMSIIIGVAISSAFFVFNLQDRVLGELEEGYGDQLNIVNQSCEGNDLKLFLENTYDEPIEPSYATINVFVGGQHEPTFSESEVEFTGEFLEAGGSDYFELELGGSFQDGVDYRVLIDFPADDLSFICRGGGNHDVLMIIHRYGDDDEGEQVAFTEDDENIVISADEIEGYDFLEWDLTDIGKGIREDKEIELDVDELEDGDLIIADYEEIDEPEIFVLSIEVEGEGSTVPEESETHEYEEGESVDISAEPEDGWVFERWKDDIDEDEDEINIQMDQDLSIVAEFEEEVPEPVTEHNLTVNINGDGYVEIAGETYFEDFELEFEEGEEVELEAETDEEDWEWREWTGDIETEDNKIEIELEEDTNLDANFEYDDSGMTPW